MKKLLLFAVPLVSLLICGTAFAEVKIGDPMKVVGKLTKDDRQREIMIETKKKEFYFIRYDKLKTAPKEFIKCIDNGNYKGTVEITASYQGDFDLGTILVPGKTATCKIK